MSALVRLEAASVDYGGRRALGPLDLAVAPGEIIALVGPSGSGKSTALRLLAGLEAPSGGRASRTLGRGDTAVVFQAPTLMPWASALDNVALPMALMGMAGARARAAEALAQVGLAEAGGLRPAQLSGGMAMRVSLARALAGRPKLLLLDEPFAALDEIVRRRLADDVLALWAEQRPAIVFVTHNVEEAAYMAARVVVLTPGPGRIAHQAEVAGPLPRPPRFRAQPGFRETVEQVSAALEAAT
jgi:NitT/TauT family transport system ATP-binding protein